MREDNADENRAENPSSLGQTAGEGSQRTSQRCADERHRATRSKNNLRETTPSEHPVAVTAQEALDGYREKTKRVANVENNAYNWVSISSAGAPDMTHCDFVWSSEPEVIIGSDKYQNRRCKKKDKDHY